MIKNNYVINSYVTLKDFSEKNKELHNLILNREERINMLNSFFEDNKIVFNINRNETHMLDYFILDNLNNETEFFWQSILLDVVLLIFKTRTYFEPTMKLVTINTGSKNELGFAFYNKPLDKKKNKPFIEMLDVVNVEQIFLKYFSEMKQQNKIDRDLLYYYFNWIASRELLDGNYFYSLSADKDGAYDVRLNNTIKMEDVKVYEK